jgi:hypothetical protein
MVANVSKITPIKKISNLIMENLIFLIQTPLALGIKKMDFGITLTIVISKKTNENSVCVS